MMPAIPRARPSLTGPQAKVAWAKQHLDNFESAHDTYRNLEPYRFTRHEDPERDRVEWRLRAAHGLGRAFTILAGDIVYNLHSALNQLAWQLVIAGNARPSNETAFPMLQQCAPERFERMTRGMPADATRIINGLQPYQRGENYPTDELWALNRLRNIDAHRSVIGIAPQINIRHNRSVTVVTGRIIEDGAVFAFASLSQLREGSFEPEMSYRLVVAQGALPTEDALGTLKRIHAHVADVAFPALEQFFQ